MKQKTPMSRLELGEFRESQPEIKFLELIGKGGHSCMFKVLIGQEIYALKLVK